MRFIIVLSLLGPAVAFQHQLRRQPPAIMAKPIGIGTSPLLSQSHHDNLRQQHRHGMTNTNSDERTSLPILSVLTSHRASSILYLLTSILTFMTPNRLTLTQVVRHTGTARKVGGAAGFAIASCVSHILYEHQKERESMDDGTRRKLNFGLLVFAFVGLASIPGESSFSPTFNGAIRACVLMQLSRVIGCVAAFRGWVGSNDIQLGGGLGNKLEEMKRGVKQTWTGEMQDGKGRKKSIFTLLFALSCFEIGNNVMCFYHAVRVSQCFCRQAQLQQILSFDSLSLFSVPVESHHPHTSEQELIRVGNSASFSHFNIGMEPEKCCFAKSVEGVSIQ